jgi:[ribosomal protein S5]-alanine N-acetyltransferase
MEFPVIDALWTNPLVTEYIGGPRDLAVVRDHFIRYAADPDQFFAEEHECWWSILEQATCAWAGLCALIQKAVDGKTETDLGYFLAPAYWHRGIATEALQPVLAFAFRDLVLESVIALIHPENAPSMAVAAKLGMHVEKDTLRMDGVNRRMYRLRRMDYEKGFIQRR